jgi:hypothetical protein
VVQAPGGLCCTLGIMIKRPCFAEIGKRLLAARSNGVEGLRELALSEQTSRA